MTTPSEAWTSLLSRPDNFEDGAVSMAWFTKIASRLLEGCRLHVGGETRRFTEIEFYYFGDGHEDIFAHKDEVQQEMGRWYFHKSRGTYRGGSFKGLDISFGSEGAFAGVLLRGLEKPDGDLVDGPSLLVDHLLDKAGYDTVAELDKAIDGRVAWEDDNPLRLEWTDPEESRPMVQCPRVGLAMWGKPGPTGNKRWRFVMRPYRYLTEPARIRKGKPQIVLSLHNEGVEPDEIHARTNSPKRTIKKYIDDFEAGKKQPEPDPYFGVDLTTGTLCKLYGSWVGAHS